MAKSHMLLLFLNQLLSRMFTFGLGILTIRYVGAIAFGLSSIHLYLLYKTILFLCREPFRRSALQMGFQYNPSKFTNIYQKKYAYYLQLSSTIKTVFFTLIPAASLMACVLSFLYILSPPDLGISLAKPPHYSELLNIENLLFNVVIPILKLDFQSISVHNYYVLAVFIYASAAVFELCSEPLYLHSQCLSNIKIRVWGEGVGNITRCVSSYSMVMLFYYFEQLNVGTAILSYALGQFLGSFIITMSFYSFYVYNILKRQNSLVFVEYSQISTNDEIISKTSLQTDQDDLSNALLFTSIQQIIPFFPIMPPQPSDFKKASHSTSFYELIDWKILSWVKAYSSQTLLKLLLTEGEKMMLVSLSPLSPEENGEYALVMNLGGLFSRLIFQPIEENAQNLFSSYHRTIKQLSEHYFDQFGGNSSENTRILQTDKHSTNYEDLQTTVAALNQNNLALETKFHSTILLSTYIGLILVTFGTSMSYSMIRILYGEKWSDNTNVSSILALYCIGQLFFAINGVTEGFLYSTVQTTAVLYNANLYMIFCSVVYIVLVWVCFTFDQLSAIAPNTYLLILCNITAMIMRILYAIRHVKNYFQYYYCVEESITIDENLKNNQTTQNQGQESSKNIKIYKVPQYSYISIIKLFTPRTIIRTLLFMCFVYNHAIVAHFLYTFTSVIPSVPELHLNPLTDEPIPIFDSHPYHDEEGLNIKWSYVVYHSFRSTIKTTMSNFVIPTAKQHLYAIACIVPLFFSIVYIIFKVERDRLRPQENGRTENKQLQPENDVSNLDKGVHDHESKRDNHRDEKHSKSTKIHKNHHKKQD